MKRLITNLMALLCVSLTFAQKDFKWDRIDTTTKSKNQIYSDTKLFIAETWKSAQEVIQNDDKDAGIILVKGISIQSKYFQMNDHKWTYSYNVKFLMKDGKYRIMIENVNCLSARCGSYSWPLIEACDTCEFPGYMKTSLNKERYSELLSSLKVELQSIVDGYEKRIKSLVPSNSDW